MGNAIEKQKPLKRSHLCPWKQGKKASKREVGSLLLGYFGSKSELMLFGEISFRSENAVQRSFRKFKFP